MQEKEILRVKIIAKDDKIFSEFLKEHANLDTAAERRQKDGKIIAEAYAEPEVANSLSKPGIKIELIEDANKTGKERQQEISNMNRFALGQAAERPKGLAKKE
jgi:hypothetical protein